MCQTTGSGISNINFHRRRVPTQQRAWHDLQQGHQQHVRKYLQHMNRGLRKLWVRPLPIRMKTLLSECLLSMIKLWQIQLNTCISNNFVNYFHMYSYMFLFYLYKEGIRFLQHLLTLETRLLGLSNLRCIRSFRMRNLWYLEEIVRLKFYLYFVCIVYLQACQQQ